MQMNNSKSTKNCMNWEHGPGAKRPDVCKTLDYDLQVSVTNHDQL